MISILDWATLAAFAATVIPGGGYVIHLDSRVTETSQQMRRHIAEQDEISLMQKKWALEERLHDNPDDMKAKQDYEMTLRLLLKNQTIQQELEKERN